VTPTGAERIEAALALDAVRSHLDAKAVEAALVRGRNLPTDQALQLALNSD
jgi:hypothetical protein